MALRGEQELGKLALAGGVFTETKLQAMLAGCSGAPPLFGERLVAESLVDEDGLQALIDQLAGQQRYTATFFYGRHLVTAGLVSKEALTREIARIKAGLKSGEEEPHALLAALVEADALDSGQLEELVGQLDAFVGSFVEAAAYGAERTPGLQDRQLLRSAYQQGMIDEKGLYGVLRKRLSKPEAKLVELLAGLLDEQQLARLQQARAATKRRTTSRNRRPPEARGREASSRRDRPAPARAPKQGVGAKLGIAISLVSVSGIIGLGLLFGRKQEQPDAGARPAAQIPLRQPEPKASPRAQSTPKKQTTPVRKAPAELPAALRKARARALAAIGQGKLARSMEALEQFQDAAEQAGGGDDWNRELKALQGRVHQQGQAVFGPRKAEIEQLIAQKKFKEADALLQQMWGGLPPSFADPLAELARALQQAMKAAEPQPKPQPKQDDPAPRATTLEEMVKRGIELMQKEEWIGALQFLSPVSAAQQGNFDCHFLKARCLNEMGHTAEALRWATYAAQQSKFAVENGMKVPARRLSEIQLLLGQVLQAAAEGELAAQAFERSLQLHALQGPARLAGPDALWMAGRFEQALAGYDAVIKDTGRMIAWPHLGRAAALFKLGRFKPARAALAAAGACADNKDVMQQIVVAHQAWLALESAGRHKGSSVRRARELMNGLSPLKPGYPVAVHGMLLVAEHDYHQADEFFRNTTRSVYQAVPEAPFAHATALLRLGRLRQARERFLEALRRRPALRRELLALPEAATIAPAVLRALADLAADEPADRLRRAADHVGLRRALVAAGDLQRANRFAEAAAAYRSFGEWIEAPSLQTEARRRAELADGLAALLARYTKKHEAESKTTWSRVPFVELKKKLETLGLSARERLLLGAQAWALGEEQAAHELLLLARKDSRVRPEVDAFFAGARGIEPPAGGFVLHRGRLVTPDERKAAKAGKRPFRGAWVDAATHARLLAGERRIDGEWVRLPEERLRFQELVASKAGWLPWFLQRSGMLTLETQHFVIRSDRGKPFVAAAGVVLEKLHETLGKVWNTAPPAGKKLTVLAFSEQRDYLAYLARFDSPAHAAAAARGAMVGSEPASCAVHDRSGGGRAAFLRAVAGEVTELFYREATKGAPPAWALEGFKAHFRSFNMLHDQVAWNRLPEQPPRILRRALRHKALLPLEQLEALDPARIDSPRKRAVWRAQSWALFHFFGKTVDERLQNQFIAWFSAATRGKRQTLEQHLGPQEWARVKDGFARFVADL